MEKLGLLFRVGKEIACVYERAKKEPLRIPTTSIKTTRLTFPISFQGQTQLFSHGEIEISSYHAQLTQQDLAKCVRQSRILHVVLTC